jgi:hypothetical protein
MGVRLHHHLNRAALPHLFFFLHLHSRHLSALYNFLLILYLTLY